MHSRWRFYGFDAREIGRRMEILQRVMGKRVRHKLISASLIEVTV